MDPTLIFFTALAVFVCYRLYAVLGTRDGHEPEERESFTPPPPIPSHGQQEDASMANDETPSENLPEWARTVQAHYAGFHHEHFIEGAKSAYEMIVQSFAAGKLEDIKSFLNPDVFGAFEGAVTERDRAGHSMKVTFVGIEKADVINAHVVGEDITVTIGFQSDQVRVVRDAEGTVVDGDENRIDLVQDQWTFSRGVHSTDPNWTLTATDGAASDEG